MMKLLKNIYLQHFFGLIGLFIIFYLAILLPNEKSQLITWWDKLNHFSAFFVASLYYIFILKNKIKACVLIFFYGIFIEIAQSYTATREASLGDVLANTLGIMIAYLVMQRAKTTQAK